MDAISINNWDLIDFCRAKIYLQRSPIDDADIPSEQNLISQERTKVLNGWPWDAIFDIET